MHLSENDLAPKIPGVDYSHGWTLVYFYPKDFTPGCTTEACSFRDNFAALSAKVKIVGISADSDESHAKFKAHYQLPFDLVADPDKQLIKSFGADGVIFPKRVSFLVSPAGKIVKVYPKVDVSKHATQVLSDLDSVQ